MNLRVTILEIMQVLLEASILSHCLLPSNEAMRTPHPELYTPKTLDHESCLRYDVPADQPPVARIPPLHAVKGAANTGDSVGFHSSIAIIKRGYIGLRAEGLGLAGKRGLASGLMVGITGVRNYTACGFIYLARAKLSAFFRGAAGRRDAIKEALCERM